jgi:hypothetical protein
MPAAQTAQCRVPGSASEIVRPEEVLIAQLVLPEIDIIRIDLPYEIAVRSEELVEISKQEMRKDVDPAVLELYETRALLAQEVSQALKNEVLGTLHIELQEIDCTDALTGEKFISPEYRALDPLPGPTVWILSECCMGAGRGMVAKRHRARVRGKPEVEALDARLPCRIGPKHRGRIRHHFQSVERRLGEQLRRHE